MNHYILKKIIFEIFILSFVLAPIFANGQCDSLPLHQKDGVAEIIDVVEESAQFPGGEDARISFFRENAKLPANWPSDSISGKVYITFLVDKQGFIKFPCILKSLNPILDSIAFAAIKKMPNWIPAQQRGQPVAMMFYLPIKFGLDKKKKK